MAKHNFRGIRIETCSDKSYGPWRPYARLYDEATGEELSPVSLRYFPRTECEANEMALRAAVDRIAAGEHR